MAGGAGRVGRPSLAGDRRRQVLDAFVGLLAERGLEGVTLDDVAAAAGVQRSVVRHYVGNRRDLLRAAVDVLVDRYTATVRAAVGPSPSADDLVAHLFGDAWITGQSAEDRALAVLFQEASRDDRTRDRLLAAYEVLVAEVAAAIRAEHPAADPGRVDDAAYQVVCLAEHNADLQLLGFPPARSAGARRAALRLIAEVGAGSG